MKPNPTLSLVKSAFTIVELLVVIVIIATLATITTMVVSKTRTSARLVGDLAKLKSLTSAIMSTCSDGNAVDPNSWVYRDEELKGLYGSKEEDTPDMVRDYLGDDKTVRASLEFIRQYKIDLKKDKYPSSFTFNDVLFTKAVAGDGYPPQNPPNWLRRPISPTLFMSRAADRPVLFLGTRNGNFPNTVGPGNPNWLNPIYTGKNISGPNGGDKSFKKGGFKVPVAFGDGSVRYVDFSERIKQFPLDSDPWWNL